LIDFTAGLCRLRERHPVFRRRQFFAGAPAPHTSRDDLDWYRPDGGLMTGADWSAPFARAVAMALSGATGDDDGPLDDRFLIMFNAWWEPLGFTVPAGLRGSQWVVEVDTADPGSAGRIVDPAAGVTLPGRSLRALRCPQDRQSAAVRPA
jgi:glycogen operon protein